MARTTGSTDLFNLIHSLTDNEKGYFQKYAKRHADKHTGYLQLFNAIGKMEKYDEAGLKLKFKNLPVLKSYLFELILQSLFISESDPTPGQTVLKGIIQVNLLLKKNLRQRALKLIDKYKRMAGANSLYFMVSYLLKIEWNIRRASWKAPERLKKIKDSYKNIRRMEDIQRNMDEMLVQQHLGGTLVMLEDNYGINYKPEKWMDFALVRSAENSLSEDAERLRLAALGRYYVLKKERALFHNVSEKVYDMETKRWRRNEGKMDPDNYLRVINNYAFSALEVRKLSLADELAESLLHIDLKDKSLEFENRLRYTHLKQEILWNSGKHREGESFSNEMVQKHRLEENLGSHWEKVIAIIGNRALFEFSNQHYREAHSSLHFFSPVCMKEYSGVEKKTAELLNLVIQFEMGNTELVKPVIKSIKQRIKSLNPQEQAFLTAFGKYEQTPKQLFAQIQAQCPQVALLHLLHISDWVESKISRKPLSEIVGKNYKARAPHPI